MSYYGTHEQAAADAKKASKQIDGLEPSATSPVRDGGADGSAQLSMGGPKEFSQSRTRTGTIDKNTKKRVEFPTEGVAKK
jgi:hypothetical protein